jgi:hypothetical protein
MTETEDKIKRQADWLAQHTLTQDQFKQLIANKFRRASEMHAFRKREALQKHR